MALFLLPVSGICQQWQGLISLDTRTGYSTNTILNPYFGQWDRSKSSVYGFISPMGQLQWNSENYSADFAGVGVYQSLFDDREDLWGSFALMNFRRRIGSSWSLGLETGGSYFASPYKRGTIWVQPIISWSPTLFSQIRVRAGSTYLDYENIQEESGYNDRLDSYGIEFEVWPTFRWQLRAGIYGNMDQPAANQSFTLNADHRISDAIQVSARLSADRYTYQLIQENGTTDGPGLPIGRPGNINGNDPEIFDETDRMIRTGISGRFRLNQAFSISMNLDHLSLSSSSAEQMISDYQLSAGVRYTIQPKFIGRGKAEPKWEQNERQSIFLKINYSGEGQLYIIGDFNDWETPGIPLTRQSSNRYAAQLKLERGAYEYKILLIDKSDERWIDFSDQTYTVSDGFGGENGMVFIE
ncbi:MAG: glycogen-binding domain-containing protein [Balneolales bacterium]